MELDSITTTAPSTPDGNGLRLTFTCSDDLILNELEKMNTFKFLGLPTSENQGNSQCHRIESGEAGHHTAEVSGILGGVSF